MRRQHTSARFYREIWISVCDVNRRSPLQTAQNSKNDLDLRDLDHESGTAHRRQRKRRAPASSARSRAVVRLNCLDDHFCNKTNSKPICDSNYTQQNRHRLCDVNGLRQRFTARFGSAFATSTDEVHFRQPRIRKTISILENSTIKCAPHAGASAVGARRRSRHAPAHCCACTD